MYPRRELKYLAYLRRRRIRSIDQRRKESCDSVRRIAKPLRLIDWTISEWRATRFSVSLAMLPVGLLLHLYDRGRLKSAQRILRGGLVVLAIARQLDRMVDVEPAGTIKK